MVKKVYKYYLYQMAGWGLLLIGLKTVAGSGGMGRAVILVVAGLVVSHLFRNVIVRYGWLSMPVKKVLPRLLAGALLASAMAGVIRESYLLLMGIKLYDGFFGTIIPGLLCYSFAIIPWTMIYYFYHYIERVHQEAVRNRELALRLNEMETLSERSVADVDTIMETLKKIQASIEEDPGRSRAEITAFSKLLREGYMP